MGESEQKSPYQQLAEETQVAMNIKRERALKSASSRRNKLLLDSNEEVANVDHSSYAAAAGARSGAVHDAKTVASSSPLRSKDADVIKERKLKPGKIFDIDISVSNVNRARPKSFLKTEVQLNEERKPSGFLSDPSDKESGEDQVDEVPSPKMPVKWIPTESNVTAEAVEFDMPSEKICQPEEVVKEGESMIQQLRDQTTDKLSTVQKLNVNRVRALKSNLDTALTDDLLAVNQELENKINAKEHLLGGISSEVGDLIKEREAQTLKIEELKAKTEIAEAAANAALTLAKTRLISNHGSQIDAIFERMGNDFDLAQKLVTGSREEAIGRIESFWDSKRKEFFAYRDHALSLLFGPAVPDAEIARVAALEETRLAEANKKIALAWENFDKNSKKKLREVNLELATTRSEAEDFTKRVQKSANEMRQDSDAKVENARKLLERYAKEIAQMKDELARLTAEKNTWAQQVEEAKDDKLTSTFASEPDTVEMSQPVAKYQRDVVCQDPNAPAGYRLVSAEGMKNEKIYLLDEIVVMDCIHDYTRAVMRAKSDTLIYGLGQFMARTGGMLMEKTSGVEYKVKQGVVQVPAPPYVQAPTPVIFQLQQSQDTVASGSKMTSKLLESHEVS
jgi:hypothetical protein